jgi:hypothetical protein
MFWGGEFNPYCIEFYALFINYFFTTKDYKQAIRLYKSSMLILIQIYPNKILIADKHVFLSGVLSSIGKYFEAA